MAKEGGIFKWFRRADQPAPTPVEAAPTLSRAQALQQRALELVQPWRFRYTLSRLKGYDLLDEAPRNGHQILFSHSYFLVRDGQAYPYTGEEDIRRANARFTLMFSVHPAARDSLDTVLDISRTDTEVQTDPHQFTSLRDPLGDTRSHEVRAKELVQRYNYAGLEDKILMSFDQGITRARASVSAKFDSQSQLFLELNLYDPTCSCTLILSKNRVILKSVATYPDESEYWWPKQQHTYSYETDTAVQKQLLQNHWQLDIDQLAAAAQTQAIDVSATLEQFLTTPADGLTTFTPAMIVFAQA